MKITQFINNQVGVLLLVAILLGLLSQPLAALAHPLITPAIIVIIILGFIKINPTLLFDEIKNWKVHLYLLMFGLIVIPVSIYYLVDIAAHHIPFIKHQHAVGALVLNGVAIGASSPALVSIINGNFERATLKLLLSSIMMIITFPTLLYLLLPAGTQVSLTTMVVSLGYIMIPAIVLGFGIKRFLPSFARYLEPKISWVSVLLLFIVVLGCQNGIAHLFFENWAKTLSVLLIATISCFFAATLGWYIHVAPLHKNRICHSVVFYFSNFGISIVIAHKWFSHSPETIFYVSVGIIPICFMPLFIKLWSRIKA